jgi:HSP20 family molecular chaperone IbpA
MTQLQRYHAADLPALMEKISKNSIGMDNYFDQFFNIQAPSNYPPYNLVRLNNHESKLEVALAGFKKDEVKVYTEFGKLHVEGTKEEQKDDAEYTHRGLAQRSFKRTWTLSEDCEVRQVVFADGLLSIELGKVVPEKHTRKDYLTVD